MNVRHAGAVIAFIALSTAVAPAQSPPQFGAPYRELKTWHERADALGGTKAERLQAARDLLRASSTEARARLDRQFKNFEGEFALDPAVEGFRKVVLNVATSNRNARKGSSRTLVYAQAFNRDPRFEVVALERDMFGPNGRKLTDKDIVVRHRDTGALCRIEVKEMTPRSQRANLRKTLRQIDLMADEFRATGELPAFVNRRPVIPEVKAYAANRGVPVYENVSSSAGVSANGRAPISLVEDDLAARAAALPPGRALQSRLATGTGPFLLVSGGLSAYGDLERLTTGSPERRADLLRLGEHGSVAAAGVAELASAFARRAAGATAVPGQSVRLLAYSRWAGRLGVAAGFASLGFVAWQYHDGVITGRQFNSQASGFVAGVAGGIGGAMAGAAAGAALGSAFPVIGTAVGAGVGAAVGGLGAGYLASWTTSYGFDAYYALKDERMRVALEQYMHEYYGAH